MPIVVDTVEAVSLRAWTEILVEPVLEVDKVVEPCRVHLDPTPAVVGVVFLVRVRGSLLNTMPSRVVGVASLAGKPVGGVCVQSLPFLLASTGCCAASS